MEDMRSGRLDGEALRVTDFTAGGDHPEYVKVDMPTLTIEWNAYALSPFAVTDWKSLGALDAQVGYRRGNHTSRLRLETVLPSERVTAYSTRTELLDALKRGEVDIAVISNQFYVQRQLTLERYRSSRIRRLAVLDKKDVCPYFAQRHADLAPVIAGTLRNMKREGMFDDYLTRLMLK